MKTGNRWVKLNIYAHEKHETVIQTLKAEDWGQFLVVRLGGLDNVQTLNAIHEELRKLQGSRYEHVILIPDSLDVEFFGIEEWKDNE